MHTQIKASYIIDLEIKAVSKEQTVGRQDVIAGKKVQSIVAFPGGVGLKTREGKVLANLENAYLMLTELDGSKTGLQIPLRSLIYDAGSPVLQFLEIGGRAFDWVNTKVLFADNPTVGEAIQLLIVYEP